MQAKLQTLGLRPLGEQFRPPSPRSLAALEGHLGQPLPAPYREFLATYGVCTFTDYVTFSLPEGPRVDVNMFLGIDPDDAYDIENTWRSLTPEHGAHLLPIALDPMGNALCLDLSNAHAGRICFIDHETGTQSAVAGSFSAFIGMLRRET